MINLALALRLKRLDVREATGAAAVVGSELTRTSTALSTIRSLRHPVREEAVERNGGSSCSRRLAVLQTVKGSVPGHQACGARAAQ